MKALILAAGMGNRLKPITNSIPKALVRVKDTPILINALDILISFEVYDIGIVVGYKSDTIISAIGDQYRCAKITYFTNERYFSTNNIVSLYKATTFFEDDDTILLECDVLFDRIIISDLISSEGDCNIMVSNYDHNAMDGSIIIVGEHGLRLVSKRNQNENDYDRAFKTVNIYKFNGYFAKKFMSLIRWYVENMGEQCYYEEILNGLMYLNEDDIRLVEVSSSLWCEIDDIKDLEKAESEFNMKGQDLSIIS